MNSNDRFYGMNAMNYQGRTFELNSQDRTTYGVNSQGRAFQQPNLSYFGIGQEYEEDEDYSQTSYQPVNYQHQAGYQQPGGYQQDHYGRYQGSDNYLKQYFEEADAIKEQKTFEHLENLLTKQLHYLPNHHVEHKAEHKAEQPRLAQVSFSKSQIQDVVYQLVDKIKNKSGKDITLLFTPYFQNLKSASGLKYQKIINEMKGLLDDNSISLDNSFQDGCKYRIDAILKNKISTTIYRFFLLSCDSGDWKIDNIMKIENPKTGAAVKQLRCQMIASMNGVGKPIGIIFLDANKDNITIKGQLIDLSAYANRKIGLHIHEFGILTPNCGECGGHYNPTFQFHGGPNTPERHVGDIGNIFVDSNGIANINASIPYYDLINFAGRSLVLHDAEDDLGLGKNNESTRTGNAGKRVACGILGVSI
jgi:Cu-Zn family superoxide dismutase